MKSTITALVAVFTIFGFISCKKEEKLSRTDLLTSGSWKLSSMTSTVGAVTVDMYARMDDCDRDNYITFSANGTMETNVGEIKCEEGDKNEISAWNFSENETIINTDDDFSGTILSLTKSELRLEILFDTESGAGKILMVFHKR